MRTSSQLLLNFLLNAAWQITLIAGASSLCDWLLRGTAIRYRHWLWVFALTLCFALPLLNTSQIFSRSLLTGKSQPAAIEPIIVPAALPQLDSQLPDRRAPFRIDRNPAMALLGFYLLFLLYRGFRLFRAWKRTKGLIASARTVEIYIGLEPIVEKCRRAIGVTQARILCSDSVPVPLTVGVRKPLVILPEQLLRAADRDILTSAVGHELVHVRRRDYLLNLIYELMFLPLSFHPAAALMKRQITKTRELRCDELVAERLLQPEVYARSLVRLAGWALPLNRRAQTIVVGIADADILEVRIMSLLKRNKSSFRRSLFVVILATVLLAIPCVAAAS